MYDTPTLLRIMSEIGFEVASKQAFESEIKDIQVIEQSDRTAESILVEGKKYLLMPVSKQILSS
jgi:hypothetical protein